MFANPHHPSMWHTDTDDQKEKMEMQDSKPGTVSGDIPPTQINRRHVF